MGLLLLNSRYNLIFIMLYLFMAFTIASPVTFEEEIKKSRFQAIAAPVENEQQVKNF